MAMDQADPADDLSPDDDAEAQHQAYLAHRIRTEMASSEVIKTILNRAKALSSVAMRKLMDVNPTDTGEIMLLQKEAGLADYIDEFIQDALKEGEQAVVWLQEGGYVD